jgi:hypothetical protein
MTLLLKFKIDIKAAIHTLGSTGMLINPTRICEQLTDCIVESYDNATSLFVYKTAWCSRISKILNDLNVKYVSLFSVKTFQTIHFLFLEQN